MNLVTKVFIFILIVIMIYAIFQVESVQKKVYDIKADWVGSDRTVNFYSKQDGTLIKQYKDKDTRFEITPTGEISIWLGNQKRKVHSNMDYILEDN